MKIAALTGVILLIVVVSGCTQQLTGNSIEQPTQPEVQQTTQEQIPSQPSSTQQTVIGGIGNTIENGGLAVKLRTIKPNYEYYNNEKYFVVAMGVNVIGDKIYISPGKVLDASVVKKTMGSLTWDLSMVVLDKQNNSYETLGIGFEKSGLSGNVLGEKTTDPTLILVGLFDNSLSVYNNEIYIVLFGNDKKYNIKDLIKFTFKINVPDITDISNCKKEEASSYSEYIDCVALAAATHNNLSYCDIIENEYRYGCIYKAGLMLNPTNSSLCELEQWIGGKWQKVIDTPAVAECYYLMALRTLNVSYCDMIPSVIRLDGERAINRDIRISCYGNLGAKLQDPTLCERKMTDEYEKSLCEGFSPSVNIKQLDEIIERLNRFPYQ